MPPYSGDDLVFLLGAGASAEAGLKMSAPMLTEVERRVNLDPSVTDSWAEYRELYLTLKGCLMYADGVSGRPIDRPDFNIERLVNAMSELDQNEDHALYPFIAAWNMRLTQHAGDTFEKIPDFQRKILQELANEWVYLKEPEDAAYFAEFGRFQKVYQAPLHVYTLNYDMCFEEGSEKGGHEVERGFGLAESGKRIWNWERMEDEKISGAPLFLYKLHGSLDWRRDDDSGELFFDHNFSNSNVDKLELIFGTYNKLTPRDPFLYFVYSFRKRTIEAKVILLIGYGLGDDHINEIIRQASKRDSEKQIVYVSWASPETREDREADLKSQMQEVYDIPEDRIHIELDGASKFLKALSKEYVDSLSGSRGEAPF